MKKLAVFGIVLLGVGFLIQHFQGQAEASVAEIQVLLQEEQKDPSHSLSSALAEVADNVEVSLEAIEKSLDEESLTESERLLANALGTDATGRAFFRFMKANDLYSTVPNRQFYIKHFFKEMEKDSSAALSQIASVLDRIPADKYGQARVQLISLLGESIKMASLLGSLARKELELIPVVVSSEEPIDDSREGSSSVQSTFTDDLALVLEAQGNVINISKDVNEIVAATVEAIMVQTNPRVQLALSDQLLSMAPQCKEHFEQKLLENKIQLTPQASYESDSPILPGMGQKILPPESNVAGDVDVNNAQNPED